MTAEHETHGMADGADALMAAITGERPPDGADAAFLAEHRRAEADVALLREQLGLIGDALAAQPRPQRRPAAVRAPRDRRPVRRFAFAGLAVAAVTGVLSGMVWLLGQSGVGGGMSADSSSASGAKAADSAAPRSPFSSPGYLACAGLVAEGEVTRVEPVPGTAEQERITLRVTRSYKPEKGKRELSLLVDEEAVRKDLRKGDRVLVAVPRQAATADYVLVGEKDIARERPGLLSSLPESADLTC
ncbi:hypothetical protein [Streptomyces sp. SLBN-31]|uniref:hypothetical protein n=1 Tax=Streptomyces sp. SLBN-31 TaxID=2768444 RepID=UPI00114ECD4A|nr:hypothetical protein [Streptomyces sp. SLBN-31]TQJ88185.1 hypothetical protein FBY22_7049 [Streptomyces sp. SLBN-31]